MRQRDGSSKFFLREGVRLETLPDGTGLVYSRDPEKSLTVNHTGALLCSYADGTHSVSAVVNDVNDLFPDERIEQAEVLAFLTALEDECFLTWA